MEKYIFPILLALLAAVYSTVSKAGETEASVGIAEMRQDRSIVLMLRARSDDGAIGDARLVYQVDSEGYAELIEHLGGLEPYQTKPIPPWPEPAER